MTLRATNSTQNRAKMLYLKQAEIRRSDEWQKAFQVRKFETIFLLAAHLTRQLHQRDGDAKVQASLSTRYRNRNSRYAPHRAAGASVRAPGA